MLGLREVMTERYRQAAHRRTCNEKRRIMKDRGRNDNDVKRNDPDSRSNCGEETLMRLFR